MKRLWVFILIPFILMSCAPQEPEAQEIAVELLGDDLKVLITPICVQGFVRPEATSPHQVIIDASPPHTFEWSIDCIPDNYYIEVKAFGDNQPIVIAENFSSNDEEYTSNVQLEPVTSYIWTVRADSSDGDSELSTTGVFNTGPVCTAQDLVAPTLISPANGSIDTGKGWGYVDEVHTTIAYPAGICTPEYFESDLSLNADFSGNDSWNIAGPGNWGIVEGSWRMFGNDTNVLNDCSIYYWHARAVVGNDFGPWSETFSFYTNFFDSCFLVSEFKGLKNTNCRIGPWVGENYAGIIREGEMATLLGLNDDASWGMFKLKNELECWVKLSLLELQPPGAVFNPAFYPILEHSLVPKDVPIPAEDSSPAPENSSPPEEVSPQGCIAPDRAGKLVCQIPCPDPKYAARVCP